MDNIDGWEIDSDLSFEPMQTLGWSIDMIPWRTVNVDWEQYDAVYICTPWDYPDDPDLFLKLLDAIDRSHAVLINFRNSSMTRWSATYGNRSPMAIICPTENVMRAQVLFG